MKSCLPAYNCTVATIGIMGHFVTRCRLWGFLFSVKGFDMKNLFLLLAMAAVGLGFTQASSAAVTSYPCHGCTLAQEEQAVLAKPGIGIRYVHNFTQHRIRKFAVVLDSAGRAATVDGVLLAKEPADFTRATPAGRDLYEMVVDSGMASIFLAADKLYAKDRTWFSSKHRRIDMRQVGLTQGEIAPREFSPAEIAWDGPNSGEGSDFLDRLDFLFEGRTSSASVSPELAEAMHDVGIPLQNVYIEGNAEGPTVGASFADGPPKEIIVDFCNSRGECVRVKITVSPNGIKTEFVHAQDSQGVNYPNESEQNINRNWRQGGREAAGDMGRFISGARNGTFIIGDVPPNCGRIVLACSDIGTAYRCQMFCAR